MKISKSLLSKIIKEEIKLALYEDSSDNPPWAVDLINYFIHITSDGTSSNFSQDESDKCKKYVHKLTGLEAEKAIKKLIGSVDPQLLQKASDKMKINGIDFGILPDPIPERHVDNDIRSSKERFDKKDDPRHGQKNWVHEE